MQIKIESAVVQQAQARLRQQSGAMRAVAVNVSSVLNGLDMQIAATQQIRQSLEALSRRCTTEQTQLEAMTQMLLAASDRFTQTDQKLGHRARGLGEAADAIGAGLAATTLPAVALRGIDRQKCADELGKTFGLRTSETLCDGVKQAVVSKKKGWFSKLKDDVSDFGSAVKTSVSNVVSAAKKSYQNHGTVYDIVEYGKGAVKIGKSIVKIAGAVAACSTVAGIPVALCIITSAGLSECDRDPDHRRRAAGCGASGVPAGRGGECACSGNAPRPVSAGLRQLHCDPPVRPGSAHCGVQNACVLRDLGRRKPAGLRYIGVICCF